MKEIIEQILKQKVNPIHLSVLDESHLHAGHAEAIKSGGGHYSVVIVSDTFNGQPLLQRHRCIHTLLKEHLHQSIHALAIKAYTPDEWDQRH